MKAKEKKKTKHKDSTEEVMQMREEMRIVACQ